MLDGTAACSAADWAELAKAEIIDLQAEGRLPILAGGTGLYLRTLLEGIAPVPTIDPGVRGDVRAMPLEAMRRRLAELDPEATTRLRPTDSARIARALEVVLSTGRPLHHWQSRREGGIGDRVELRPLVLLPPREWLYPRCDERFAKMIDQGAIEEVRALMARGLHPDLPVMRAIGVREIASFLAGEASRVEATAAGQQATRRYAKRQYTWFAHQPPPEWPRILEPVAGGTADSALELLSASA